MRELACKDAGMQCDKVMRGNSDEEVLRQASAHAAKEHGIDHMTPDMEQSLRQKIKNV